MVFEIEKRAKVSISQFKRVKRFLDKNAKYLGKESMKSFLFNKPTYLRIRVINGKKNAIITYKSGNYNHKARKELNKNITISKLKKFILILKAMGFKECVSKKTERQSYKFKGLKVELNKIETLGLIIEVEAICRNKNQISKLSRKVGETMKTLGLKELQFSIYQKMMDKLYSKSKLIDKHSFT